MSLYVYTFTKEDMVTIRESANRRISVSKEAGLNHASTYERNMETRLRQETVGVAAELAWARINKRIWHDPINEFHSVPDDGNHEIRATDHPGGGLVVRGNDPDDRKYIFAIIDEGMCTFYGWALGSEVKKDENLWNPHGFRLSWRLHRSRLHPISSLYSDV